MTKCDSERLSQQPDERDEVIARLRSGLIVALSIADTPIARRRLNIDGNDERLVFARTALGEG